MLTRRELMAGGMFGGMTGGGGAVAQSATSADVKRIAGEVSGVRDAVATLARGQSPSDGIAAQVREPMHLFLRANGKFPDYCEVGIGIFEALYDWHIRFQLPVVVERLPDQRYVLVFMFTRMVLRTDTDPDYLGIPYDQR